MQSDWNESLKVARNLRLTFSFVEIFDVDGNLIYEWTY